MRFDIHSADDDRSQFDHGGAMAEDANWPVGHLALGEQLRDDATFLAERYPAGAPPALLLALADCLQEEPAAEVAAAPIPASPEVAAPARSISWTALLAGVLAGVALVAVAVVFVPQWLPKEEGNPVATGKESPAPLKPMAKPEANLAAKIQPEPAAPKVIETPVSEESGNPMTPAFFEELSGPEREGLLDLLEDQSQEKPRLSL